MPQPSSSLARKVARHVLTETLRVRRGENVTIEAWSESLPWAVPFVNEVRRLGARPLMLYEDEEAFWEAIRNRSARATGIVGDHEWNALAHSDAYVFFFGPAEWPRFDEYSEQMLGGVAAYNPEWYRRAAKARVRGARMYIGRTSAAAARRWKVNLNGWRDALQRASLVSPRLLNRSGTRVAERLRRGRRVHVTHPNGTDLEFDLGHYPVQLDDALVDARDLRTGATVANIPGGVVGVAIDHTSASGTVVGNHTVYPDTGPTQGIRWTFRDGHLVKYSYAAGGRAFRSEYRAAPPNGRDRLGFVSIGLNPELSSCPQMEDQELGAVLFRIGGNQFVGGKNPSPFGSWALVSGGNVAVDGRVLVRRGKIL